MTNRLQNPYFYHPDNNGNPVPFGLLYTYSAGTLDNLVTYQDENGTPNSNPVVMDASGKASVILDGNYRLIFRTAAGVLIFDIDDISSQEVTEWINTRPAMFISTTSIFISGDHTSTYQVSRGIRIDNNPAYAYSICSTVVYDGGTNRTTITIANSVITSGVVAVSTSVVGPNSKTTQSLIAALAAASGAASIGVAVGGNLQTALNSFTTSINALDFQPYNASLDVPIGGRRKGSNGLVYRALIANGPTTTVVNPVGDVTGTWLRESPVTQFYTDSGTANTYVLTASPASQAPTAYVDGLVVIFVADNQSTGASTVDVSSLGSRSIVRPGGSALLARDISATEHSVIVYDLANTRFVLQKANSLIEDLVFPAYSSSPNGYIEFQVTPTLAFVIQYGSNATSSGGSTHSFPIAFTSARAIVASANNGNAAVQAEIVSASQFRLTVGTGTPNAFWIAIGTLNT